MSDTSKRPSPPRVEAEVAAVEFLLSDAPPEELVRIAEEVWNEMQKEGST